MASPRQLSYKDRFVWHLEQVISSIFDDCDDFTDRYVFPDMDTRVPFVITLSQREWTTLYSAVLTGADLSYPDTSQDVEYLFLQTVICPMSQLCAAMIDCLQNDPDVWAALQALLADNGYTGGVGDPNEPVSDDVLGENLLPAGYVCTDDAAFGMALAVVNSINDATTEVLQAIEILTNPVEIAAELGDNVPGVGALASAGDVANWIQDTAKEQYDLAWSVTVRDELACLLWCEFKWDCELSFDTVWDVYLGAADVSPPASVLLTDWLAWLILLPFTASLSTVSTISLLGLLAMRYGGSFGDFQLGIRSLETVIALSASDTSSDWSTVCDPCLPAWCYNFNFLTADGSWANLTKTGRPFGIWVSGEGWESVWGFQGGTWAERLYIWRGFADTYVTDIECTFRAVGTGGPDPQANIVALLDDVQLKVETITSFPTDGTPVTFSLSVDLTIDEVWLVIISDPLDPDDLDIFITSCKLTGTGTNPFGADNC